MSDNRQGTANALAEIEAAQREGRGANLSYANLSDSDLRSADLRYANLRYANLSGSDLSHADLCRASLSGADLSHADLSYANLSHAHLSRANLRHADLSRAELSHADLSYANLSGATLDNLIVYQVGPLGSRRDYLVYMRHPSGIEECRAGCWTGTPEELAAQVSAVHGDSKYGQEYRAVLAMFEQLRSSIERSA